MELAFGDRALTEEADRHRPRTAEYLIGESEPDGNRKVAADDGVAPEEAGRRVEEMHRTAPPARTTRCLAEHLAHDRLGGDATQQCVAVFAVGREHGVGALQATHDPGCDCLLTDVEVEESPDLRLAVQLGAPLLEDADPDHVREQ